jgi:hypothetical protein
MSGGAFEVPQQCPGWVAADRLALQPTGRCACRLYFQNPRPSAERILAYYDRGETYRRFPAEWAVRERIWAARLDRVRRFCAGGRLLDVGTGDGHFLLHARTSFAAEGTEVSRSGSPARARCHRAPRHARASTCRRCFDVVTLARARAPAAAGRRVGAHSRPARPGGHLWWRCPAGNAPLDLCRFGWRREPVLAIAAVEIHLVHFTPKVLSALLERSVFAVRAVFADDVDTVATLRSSLRERSRRVAGWLLGRRWSTATAAVCVAAFARD